MIISNKLTISPSDSCYPVAKLFCENELTFDNPAFQQAERMGFWTGNIPRKIRLYTTDSDNLMLPFGCYKQFLPFMQGKAFELDFASNPPNKMQGGINLYDYQEVAVREMIKAKNGILIAPTGCLVGETEIMINRSRCSKKTTLEKFYKSWNNIGNYKGIQNKSEVYVRGLRGERVGLNKVQDVLYSGKKMVYELELENGKKIQLTKEHKIYTQKGYVEAINCLNEMIACDLNIKPHKTVSKIKKPQDTYVEVSSNHPHAHLVIDKRDGRKCYRISLHKAMYETKLNGFEALEEYKKALESKKEGLRFVDSNKYSIHHIDGNHKNNSFENLTCMAHEEHLKLHGNYKNFGQGIISYSRCISVVEVGFRDTYDICCESNYPSFTANGVIVHNSGKTSMGIELIHRLGKKALWVCHTKELLEQAKERAESCFNGEFGTITEGKINIGRDITFATVQTLSKQDLSLYKYSWDVIVVDELQRVVSTPNSTAMFEKVLNNLAARYKFGVTASLSRSDGLQKCAEYLVGNIICEVPREAVADKIMNARVEAVKLDTPESLAYLGTDGMLNYTKLLEYLCTNHSRNSEIARRLNENTEHYNLILSDRTEHLRSIMSLVERQDLCCMVDGKMTSKKAKELRRQYIEQTRTGEKRYLFATYGLAKEGLDIPRLDRLYLTTPHKDKSTILQSVGRIRRKCEGKGEPIVYDFVDDNIEYCVKAHKTRRTTYKKIDCIIDKKY